MREPTMVFIRRFDGRILGGHLKVFDYARHVAASALYRPALYVTPESSPLSDDVVGFEIPRVTSLEDADALFVAGLDWRIIMASGVDLARTPVVNLIQGFAHLREGDPRRDFLELCALRICVSRPLFDAVAATGMANGPLYCIENATDVTPVHAKPLTDASVFIAGMKASECARAIAELLEPYALALDLQTDPIPRESFLARLRAASVAVVLPDVHDGFFLPALEAMALGCAVVVPRVAGVESYCIDGETALVTDYTAEAIATAARALCVDARARERLSANGVQRAALHSLDRERSQFLQLLERHAEDWLRNDA